MTDPQHQPELRFWRFWARNWFLGPVAAGIALVLLCSLGIWLALLLAGCGPARPAPPPPPPPPIATPNGSELPEPSPPPADDAPLKDKVAYWENRATVLQGTANRYQADAKTATTEANRLRQEASLAAWRSLMTWATWAGGIVALGGFVVALAVGLLKTTWPALGLLPIGWRSAAVISAGGIALAAGAQALYQIAPWLPALGLGLVIVAIIGLLAWAAWRWKVGGVSLAGELRTYAKHLPKDLREALDEQHPLRQRRAKPAVDDLLAAAP
jgi:hypothetical protein